MLYILLPSLRISQTLYIHIFRFFLCKFIRRFIFCFLLWEFLRRFIFCFLLCEFLRHFIFCFLICEFLRRFIFCFLICEFIRRFIFRFFLCKFIRLSVSLNLEDILYFVLASLVLSAHFLAEPIALISILLLKRAFYHLTFDINPLGMYLIMSCSGTITAYL